MTEREPALEPVRLSSILQKLGARDRAAAIVLAGWRGGLAPPLSSGLETPRGRIGA